MKRFLKHAFCLFILCIPLLLASCTGEGGEEPITDGQGLIYTLLSDGTYSVAAPDALEAERLEIPSTYNGRAVTEIAENAFNSLVKSISFSELVIPSGIVKIGANAFSGIAKFDRIYISDLAAWCCIDFASATSNPLGYADELIIDGKHVTELIIPETVEKISDYAFAYCTAIKGLVLHDGVTEIGARAFIFCTALTSVTLGSGLTLIGDNAFLRCDGVTELINRSAINLKKEFSNAMDTVKFEKNSTRVVSHAGLAGIEVANTEAAFLAAAKRSYYGIETDVRKTKDGYYVCFHDPSLLSKAGVDASIESLTLAEIREIVLFERDGSRGRDTLRIPTLEEYVRICKEYGKVAVIELKPNYFTREDIGEIIDIVRSLDYLDHSEFISFYFDNLAHVRYYLPDAKVGVVFSTLTDETLARIVNAGFNVTMSTTIITKEWIDRFHENGITVCCYTVDDPDRAEQLAEWGVDFIITNRLE